MESCDGVVECTALVLAESCTEFDGRLTLFGVLDEIVTGPDGSASFVVYAKFEGCEHAGGERRTSRILVTDDDGSMVEESDEFDIWLDGPENSATVVAAFDLPEGLEREDEVLWIEAVLDGETVAQTALPVRERYSV
ncbi:MAG: hypothetical protein K6T51_12030 [Rubrobacteraceae bacterium]|uniref:hypothetical protein n=1 Tax=Rubrobacter naiadicus TaxID=1392641 RepID=UPI00235DE8E0|nr:hypothetical protein [Rubrobacter naiadicus]MBX6762759.1 hypothetical protein [Rubrobacteraceae bacterium]MCL6439329.1 hypothetical protein [Rubrobacteraceae bacterium]